MENLLLNLWFKKIYSYCKACWKEAQVNTGCVCVSVWESMYTYPPVWVISCCHYDDLILKESQLIGTNLSAVN